MSEASTRSTRVMNKLVACGILLSYKSLSISGLAAMAFLTQAGFGMIHPRFHHIAGASTLFGMFRDFSSAVSL
jgi:hypothetical protein